MKFKDFKKIIRELNKTLKDDDVVITFNIDKDGRKVYTYEPFTFEDVAIISKNIAGKAIRHKDNNYTLDQDAYDAWIKRTTNIEEIKKEDSDTIK